MNSALKVSFTPPHPETESSVAVSAIAKLNVEVPVYVPTSYTPLMLLSSFHFTQAEPVYVPHLRFKSTLTGVKEVIVNRQLTTAVITFATEPPVPDANTALVISTSLSVFPVPACVFVSPKGEVNV